MSIDVDAVLTTARILSETIVQIGLAVFIVSQAGSRRRWYAPRLAIAALVLGVYALVAGYASVALAARINSYVLQGATFVLILAALSGAVLLCHDISPLTALSYATAGYASQNLGTTLFSITRILMSNFSTDMVSSALEAVLNWGYMVPIYLVLLFVFARRARRQGFAEVTDRWTLLLATLAIMVVIVYDIAVKYITGSAVDPTVLLILRLVQVMICAFIVFTEYEMLYNRRLRTENAAAARMLADAGRQYELSRDTIEHVNIMCHDIRHQIRDLREASAADPAALDALEQQVGVYDAKVRTGNDALDVILSEKRLQCEREGIELTCIADGRALDFLDPADLYALVGNALDNAIDASRELPEGERTVSITVREACGMASMHVENRYAGARTFEGGMPAATTKADRANHGFGTRSMRLVAERHGGTLTFAAEDGVFIVDALIPLA